MLFIRDNIQTLDCVYISEYLSCGAGLEGGGVGGDSEICGMNFSASVTEINSYV